jgi:hypothetical protein
MQTIYHGWATDRQPGGFYVIVPSNQILSIKVKKSAAWIQSGATISGGTTLRVCYGSTYTDIFISNNGNISDPGGSWGGSGNETSTNFSNNIIRPAYPFPGNLGEIGNRIDPGGPSYNPPMPPGATYEEYIATLNGLANLTTSDPFIVYAYEITSATPTFQNPPGWTPKWIMEGWQEQLPIGSVVPRPGDGLLDQQMVSIFSQKISVSQSDYGFVGKSVFVPDNVGDYINGLESGLEEPYNTARNAEIVITIDPMNYVDGYPVMNGNPWTTPNYTSNTGGREQTNGGTKKPPRDGSGDNPVYGYPGGGFSPTAPEFIAIEVTPDPIAHDNTDVGTFKTKSFTIKNTGTIEVEIDNIVNTHPNQIFTFGMNNPISLPFSIEPDEQFGGTAYFIPASAISYTEIGYVKKGINILKTFSVTGLGTASGNPGDVPLRSISLRGDVTTSGNRNFLERTIGSITATDIYAINTGSVPVVLNSVALGGSGVFTSTGVTAGFNLQPGQELAIPVNFTPVGAQEYLGTFTLNTNAQTSPQIAYFNPSTGAILANLSGEGVPEEVLTRIMSFNIQNNGTFEDALAGGSATTELDGTITNIGNASLLIDQFQVQPPFSLELDTFGTYTIGSFEFYSLDEPFILAPSATSPIFKVKFTPPTATNYVDDVFVDSNKTIGPEAFEVRGTGTFEVPPEPEEPDVPVTPDDEPPPGQEFDPGTVPSSALDGNGSACIPKECDVVYVYEYSSNGEIVT